MKISINVKDKKVNGSVAHEGEAYLPLKGSKEKDFIKKLNKVTSHNLGLLPPAIRWISRDKSIVVFERPAMRQLVEFLPYERNGIDERTDYRKLNLYCSYELNIPWTVYVCTFDATYLPVIVKVFARNTPLTSMNDTLGLMPLLNFYGNSKLCNPATKIFEGMPESLGEGINMAYNLVWNSGWNFDLHDAINLCQRYGKPFMAVELQKGKLRIGDLTPPEKHACQASPVAQTTISMFKFWSTCSMDDILHREWSIPSSTVKGSVPKTPLTLATAIQTAQTELQMDGSTQSRTFLVNIASALM